MYIPTLIDEMSLNMKQLWNTTQKARILAFWGILRECNKILL